MQSEVRQKFLKTVIILGPKNCHSGVQFCRILVLGPHIWWSGGSRPPGPPGSAPVTTYVGLCLQAVNEIKASLSAERLK